MKNRTNLLRGSVVLCVALAAAASSFAFRFILNGDTGLPIKWPAGSIPIKIMLGTSPVLTDGSTFNSSAHTAATNWNNQIGSAQYVVTETTGTADPNNNLNELVFADDVFGKAFGANVLAVTTTSYIGNQYLPSDIVFNKHEDWDSYRGTTRAKRDVQRVAMHELGHLLGLDHPDDDSTVQPRQAKVAIMNSHISDLDALSTDDIQGAQSLYGLPNVPANDNFANATLIDFSSGTRTLTGYNTKATKETGEPNHAGNVGGRSVWYRWKPNVSASAIVDTKGSYYDTTLAVHTGTAVNALTEVASNDDVTQGVVQASTVTFNVTAGVTYYIAVDGFNNVSGTHPDNYGADNAGFTLNLNLTGVVLVAPTITTQPASATVNAGQSVTFSVAVTGSDPISYQWLFNGLVISGATDSSFSLNSAQTLNAGKYSVKVTNTQGTVTSNEATLTVNTVTTPTPPTTPSGGGGGGGGGAPSPWFIAVLMALGMGRLLSQRRC